MNAPEDNSNTHARPRSARPPRAWGAHARMLLSTALVATSFPVVERIAGALDSRVLVALRFALASLLFAPWVVLRHGRAARPSVRALARYSLLSACLVAFFLAMFEALKTTTSLNTGVLFTLAPAFASLFASRLSPGRTSRASLVGLALGALGAAWVVVGGDPRRALAFELARGDALFLAGTAALGLYSALIRRLHRGEPSEVMMLWTLFTGTLWLTAASLPELAAVDWSHLEPRIVWPLVYLAIFTTLVTFLLTQRSTLAIGPARTMSYTLLNPSFVALLAWGFEGKALDGRAWPGIGLTLFAVVLLQTADESSIARAKFGAPRAGDSTRAEPRPTARDASSDTLRAREANQGTRPGGSGDRGTAPRTGPSLLPMVPLHPKSLS